MKLATVIVGLYKGHEVVLHDVTPAEVLFLVAEHNASYGGDPIIGPVVETGDTDTIKTTVDGKEVVKMREKPWTAVDEVDRLRRKYGEVKCNILFPGSSPTVPTSYDEAREKGVKVKISPGRLSEQR